MASLPKILLTCTLIVLPIEVASVEHLSGDHHGFTSHRLLWPLWYHEKLTRSRHDRDGRSFQEPTARSWARQDPYAERSTSTVAPLTATTRYHVEQRLHEQRPGASKQEKLRAVAVAEYSGTRAVAYASYHNNHRHQPREAVTQSYQHLATTPSTYTRHHPGRRVCTRSVPTSSTTYHHRRGQIRYLNVFNINTDTPSSFLCCPGWTQATHLSFGCNKPTCPAPCLNGGICISPGRCTCSKGFTGNQCQTDVDECVTEKPCDQLCRNLPGTYECHCRPGFQLQKDGQSCRKNDTDDTAFEARDLEDDFHEATTTKRPSISSSDTENEVADGDLDQDYEIILKRLTKLEKQFAKGKKRDSDTTEMGAKVASVIDSINEMKRAVENVQLMQQEMYEMRSKLREYEMETRKMQHLTNRVVELENRMRLRCRTAIPMNSGSLNF